MPKIYAMRLNWPLDEKYFQGLLDLVDMETKHKAQSYRNKEDAYRSLAGGFLAKFAIAKNADIKSENIAFKYTSFGKPYIQGWCDLHFNISHAGHWVVCAIDNKPIGIDIENMLPVDIDTYRGYFSEEESRWLSATTESSQQSLFYE